MKTTELLSRSLCLSMAMIGIPGLPGANAAPIKVSATNGHYFEWNGQPALLVTSAEHYGAVVNSEFNYTTYLDTMKAKGNNYTRIYPGAYMESPGTFVEGNTLGPNRGKAIVPWARRLCCIGQGHCRD